jgi:hypothetical protein
MGLWAEQVCELGKINDKVGQMPDQYCACFCVCCNQYHRRIIAYFALEEALRRSYASFALPLFASK